MDFEKTAAETGEWFLDRRYTKFYVLPTSARVCELGISLNTTLHQVITVNYDDPLPFTKTVTIPKVFANNVLIRYLDRSKSEPAVHRHHCDSKCHEIQFTLIVDTESFSRIKIEGLIKDSIKSLPDSLNKQATKNIPVIGFYEQSSVICVCKEDGYKFLDSWKGLYGKELIISFDKEKPSFCDDALELLRTKPTFAVYDLIKIMSMPADKLVADKLWTFAVTEDVEHPVLLEFNTYDGTKKAASPAFLMAMLLKRHLKAIKKETKGKPDELGIRFFHEFTNDEQTRVEAGLKEACELLKIDCFFV